MTTTKARFAPPDINLVGTLHDNDGNNKSRAGVGKVVKKKWTTRMK